MLYERETHAAVENTREPYDQACPINHHRATDLSSLVPWYGLLLFFSAMAGDL